MSLLVTCAVGLILKSTAKRYVTAGAQRSQRKMRCRVLISIRHGHIRLVCAVLCAPGVSAARLCSEVMLETHRLPQKTQHRCAHTGI
jgi:hypothetical protein